MTKDVTPPFAFVLCAIKAGTISHLPRQRGTSLIARACAADILTLRRRPDTLVTTRWRASERGERP